MEIALDTSAYSALCRGDRAMLEWISSARTVGVSSVVLGELHSGFRAGSREAQNEAQLRRFLGKPSVRVLDVTEQTALHYAQIDVYLRKAGQPIPRNDVWIAASAMQHGMQLLTLDRHFALVPMLLLVPVEG